MKEKNILNEQKLEESRKINVDNEFKDGEAKLDPIKDTIGLWTDKQIEENPKAYMKYLKEKLESAYARQDLQEIKVLVNEIFKMLQKYFPEKENLEQSKTGLYI